MRRQIQEGKNMNKNNNDTFLRIIALRKAYEKNLINEQMYSIEMEKVQQVRERIEQLEEEKRELINRTKKNLSKQLATSY